MKDDNISVHATLRALWLLADTYPPADLAGRLSAPARAEFIEHGPKLERFFRDVCVEIEEDAG